MGLALAEDGLGEPRIEYASAFDPAASRGTLEHGRISSW